MKKLYKDFFQVSEHEKVSDKVFYTRLVLSIVTIAVCMIILCSTSFAWFTTSQGLAATNIVAAHYQIHVTLDSATESSQCTLTEQGYYVFDGSNQTKDVHQFTISVPDNGTANQATTGYCKIVVVASDGVTEISPSPYYTTQIAKGESITLTIVTAKGYKIQFIPQWGTSSNYVQEGLTTYENGAVIDHSRTVEPASGNDVPMTKASFDKEVMNVDGFPSTRVVFGSYENYKEELDAKGVGWESGEKFGSKDEARVFTDEVRRFHVVHENTDGTVTITRYILAEGNNTLYFPEDSSNLFQYLSPYVASVEFANVSMENVKDLSGIFKDCQRLVRIYAREKAQESQQTQESQQSVESQELQAWDESKITVESEKQKEMFLGCEKLKGGVGTTVQWIDEVLKNWEQDFKIAEDNQTLYDRITMLGEMLNSTDTNALQGMLDEMKNTLLFSVQDNREVFRIDQGPCTVGEDGKCRAGLLTSITQKNSDQELLGQYSLYKVQENDTLEEVAEKFGMTVETLLRENHLEANASVETGDWLIINCVQSGTENAQ